MKQEVIVTVTFGGENKIEMMAKENIIFELVCDEVHIFVDDPYAEDEPATIFPKSWMDKVTFTVKNK